MLQFFSLHQRLLITSVSVLFVALASVGVDWWRRRDLSRFSISAIAIMWLLLASNGVVGGFVVRQVESVAGLHILYGVLALVPVLLMWYLHRWVYVTQRARFWVVALLVTAVLVHRVVATG